MALDNFAGGNSQAQIELYSNGVSNLPGVFLETLGTITFGGAQNYSISASGNTMLAPDTQYWVVLKFVSGDFNWTVTTDQSTSGSGTLVGFQLFSANGGSSWGGGFASEDYKMQVNGISLRVLTSFDTGAGSIRDVIAAVPAGSTLEFDPTLNGAAIQLNSGEHLLIDKDLIIDVTGFSKGLTIDARNFARIFRVEAGNTLTLRGLDLVNGNPGVENGGAILCLGSIGCPANLTLDRCRISGCTAVEGGAIAGLVSELELVNSTLVDNTAENAGAVTGTGTDLSLTHCTVTGNAATTMAVGAKIGGLLTKNGGSLVLRNSLVAGNRVNDGTTPELIMATATEGVNFIGTPGTATGLGTPGVDYLSGDPELGPLSCYGGATQARHPRATSRVIDAGGTLAVPASVDQRGFARDLLPDIGAIEAGPVILVDEAGDENGTAGPADTSLREAVRDSVPGGRIHFAPSLAGTALPLNSQITLNTDLFISVANLEPGAIVVQGDGSSRVFEIPPDETAVAMDAFVVMGGQTTGNGGGILHAGEMLTLIAMNLYSNEAAIGGGVHVSGGAGLVAENCTLTENHATNVGGVTIDAKAQSRVFVITGSVPSPGVLTLIKSTISGNATERGGNARFNGLGGGAGDGGGIFSSGMLTVNASTIVDNFAVAGGTPNGTPGNGGGIFDSGTNPLNLHSSIVAGNMAIGMPENLSTTNLVETGVNFTFGDPKVAPLGHYGGRTLTRPPLSDSPVIDTGGAANPGGTDQRGFPRFVGGQLDIGAVEYQGMTDPVNSGIADFAGDDDDDGNPNGIEAAIGTNPLVDDSESPRNLSVTLNGTASQLTFGYDPTQAPFFILRVTRSTDLIDFDYTVTTNEGIPFGAPNGAGLLMVVDDDPPAGGLAIYRLEVLTRF